MLGVGNNNFENVIIVAHEDNTEVFVNGSALSTVNSDTSNNFLNAGEYLILEGKIILPKVTCMLSK